MWWSHTCRILVRSRCSRDFSCLFEQHFVASLNFLSWLFKALLAGCRRLFQCCSVDTKPTPSNRCVCDTQHTRNAFDYITRIDDNRNRFASIPLAKENMAYTHTHKHTQDFVVFVAHTHTHAIFDFLGATDQMPQTFSVYAADPRANRRKSRRICEFPIANENRSKFH